MHAATMGERIRTRRVALKLKQAAVAKAVGVEPQSLWRIEAGKVLNPGIELVAQIAGQLAVSVDYLVHGTNPPDATGAQSAEAADEQNASEPAA